MMMSLSGQKLSNFWPLVEARFRIIVVASLGLLLSTACAVRSISNESQTILSVNGSGTSPNDVAAIEKILSKNDFSYTTANSRRLNEMGESQLRAYRLLIVPGGNFEQIGNGLTSSAEFGNLIWALPSFWCKRRGSLRIGASQLLIAVSALRLASIQR